MRSNIVRFRQFVFVVLQSSCSDLFLLPCFNVRSRLGPSPVQNMPLSKQCSDRRRSDLGRRLPKLPKRRLCRGLRSSTCGVGPNLPRSRVSRNLTTKTSSTPKKLKSAQSSQARDPKREIGKVSRTRSSDAAWFFDPKVSDEEHLQNHRGSNGYCIRCDFIQRPKLFDSYSLHEGRSWIARGESRGKWGLGCKLCAEYSRCRHIDSVYSSTAPRFPILLNSSFDPIRLGVARDR